MMIEAKIGIGIPTMEMARQAKFYDYVDLIQKPKGTVIFRSHGQSPAQNRNIIIKEALKHNCTHILFIDDDVLVPPDIIAKLLHHNKHIVSGLYLMRGFPHAPIAFNVALKDAKCRFKFLDNKETGLVQVVNFGLGACLINTEVFRKVKEPWITIGQCGDHTGWNDDIEFFNRCRDEYGFKLWLDLDVWCGHMGTVTIWPNYKDGQWLTTYDTAGAGSASFYAATPKQVYGNDEYEKYVKENQNKVIMDLS